MPRYRLTVTITDTSPDDITPERAEEYEQEITEDLRWFIGRTGVVIDTQLEELAA